MGILDPRRNQFFLAAFFLLAWISSLHANVYATDIQLNGSSQAGVLVPGGSLVISYILNDNASSVFVQIRSGTNVVKTFASTGGDAGTNLGLNTITWDGAWDTGSNDFNGTYSVSITAASQGYEQWTNITDDGPGFKVSNPRGVDVNRNTNSPYYGRVFVSGDIPEFGIYKYNPDGSPADEGGFSTGGLPWGMYTAFPDYSPWKIAVAPSDEVYVNDFSGYGLVYGFDETISPQSIIDAITPTNYPYWDPELSGLYVTGNATNEQLWMGDFNPQQSSGVLRWQLTANGTVATNDTGTVIAPAGTNALSSGVWDLAVDANSNLYVLQLLTNNAGAALISFPPYEGSPETNASWATAPGTLIDAYGVAVNPAATLVAVAVRGLGDEEDADSSSNLDLYYAATGQFLTNLDETGGDRYTDVAWDNAGNLYALDTTLDVWRAYSPPGTNQATTVAYPFIQEYPALAPPALTQPQYGAGQLDFVLNGQSNVTYVVQQSSDLINWCPVLTNYSPNPARSVSIPSPGSQDFYRALASP